MTLNVGTAARNAACAAVVGRLDIGGAGSIAIYSGTKPATPQDAATGTLLVTLTLPSPAFGTASSGTATLNTVTAATAVAGGAAAWFRAKSGDGTAVLDGMVATTGAELTLASTTITSGGSVTITSGTVTMPG